MPETPVNKLLSGVIKKMTRTITYNKFLKYCLRSFHSKSIPHVKIFIHSHICNYTIQQTTEIQNNP